MATAIVRARRRVTQCPCDEEPLRVIFSRTEPARNYVWCKPNGAYYVWNGCKWVPGTCPKPPHPKDPKKSCCEFIEKSWVDSRLDRMKKEILDKVKKLIAQGGSSGGGQIDGDIQQQIEQLSNEITRLQQVDNSVNSALEALSNIDSQTNERLESLEAHDTTNCVTAIDV